ncbi:hypothetical protein F5141DRAFT_1180225 [Pisolithus sp. B1]|nr:hypothetical protein F5141DRAFT_1180225 [Pisolithus sp. B1]
MSIQTLVLHTSYGLFVLAALPHGTRARKGHRTTRFFVRIFFAPQSLWCILVLRACPHSICCRRRSSLHRCYSAAIFGRIERWGRMRYFRAFIANHFMFVALPHESVEVRFLCWCRT